MCFCDPQSSCQFPDGAVPLHWGGKEQRETETEKGTRGYLQNSHCYICARQSGGPSRPHHLSLISDKALFKCLLSWPILDWRWHLRNTSKEGLEACQEGGVAVGSWDVQMLLLRSCQCGDGVISQWGKAVLTGLMSSMGDHLLQRERLRYDGEQSRDTAIKANEQKRWE